MQGLVYIFIGLAALGVAGTAYFGLSFTPIEAFVVALTFGGLALILLERTLRRRAEARLERAIEDLSRLLSTDAQAGAVLSQRINALAEADAASRLDAIEADVSVLGTVVRQVAEAVAEQDDKRRPKASDEQVAAAPPTISVVPEDDGFPEPVVSVEMLRQSLADNRMVHHVEPVLALPQHRPYGYDLVSRLQLYDGLADAPDFMPRRGHADLVRRIEALALEEAVAIARHAHASGGSSRLFVALTQASLNDTTSFTQLLAILDANRDIANSLAFTFGYDEWKQLLPGEKAKLDQIGQRRVALSLTGASSLRFNFGELEEIGFTTVRFDATRFLRNPETFTDFHVSDIASYSKRFRIDLVATGVNDEQQLLTLFESGVTLMQGPHISKPEPVREEMSVVQPPGSGAVLQPA